MVSRTGCYQVATPQVYETVWGFPYIGIPQNGCLNGWVIMDNSIFKWMSWGHPISGNPHVGNRSWPKDMPQCTCHVFGEWMMRRRIGAELYSHYIRKLQLKHTKRIQKKHKSNWYSAISFGLLENVTRSFAHHVSRAELCLSTRRTEFHMLLPKMA